MSDNQTTAENLMDAVIHAIDSRFCPGYASKNPALVNSMLQATAKVRRIDFEEALEARLDD